MNPKLKAMLGELLGMARLNLRAYGHLLPVAFVFSKGGFDIVGCPWTNDAEKEASVIGIRKIAREKNAEAVAILAEAWRAKLENCKSLDDWDGTPPSQMANRQEVVQLYVETLDGYWLGVAPMTRDKGYPTFGAVEWQPMQERDACERFQKFLA